MLNKANLRQTLIAKRSALDPLVRAQWDAAISAKLLEWWDLHRPPTLGVYWPMRQEPDLQDAYVKLAEQGVQLALPVVIEKQSPLAFALWAPGEEVVKGSYGVTVPAVHDTLQPAALLIPCVGFNGLRFRVGYGGGFYDRTLALQPRPAALGVAYACLQAEFNADPHDIALDTVLTEQGAL